MKNDPVIRDVNCSYCWLLKSISTHHPVLLQLDHLAGVQRGEGKICRRICRKLWFRLNSNGLNIKSSAQTLDSLVGDKCTHQRVTHLRVTSASTH